ncbi:MAG: hypothetical protein ABIJ83_04800 [Patescibacteria group bacterium]|nr:hypothetical protein [Patescibacteria group bacterium]
MSNLLTLKFWFNLRPDVLTPLMQKIFLAMIIVSIIFTILFGYMKILKKKGLYSKMWDQLYYFSFINCVIGLILMFLNYEMVPFLTARFWYLLWFVVLVVWLFCIIKNAMKIPKKRQQLEKEKEFNKYIP